MRILARLQSDGYSLMRDQVATMLDAFVRAEGEPEVVQFSGGEPTIHRDIVPFVEMARERGIKVLMLNTNGIRLAHDQPEQTTGPSSVRGLLAQAQSWCPGARHGIHTAVSG